MHIIAHKEASSSRERSKIKSSLTLIPGLLAQEILENRQKEYDSSETQDFAVHLKNRGSLQKQALERWQQIHTDIFSGYDEYKNVYSSAKLKGDDNLQKFQSAVKQKDLLSREFTLEVEQLTAGCDSSLVDTNKEWISTFAQDQTSHFSQLFNSLAAKVSQQRLSLQNIEKRKKIEESIEKLFSDLDKARQDKVDPFIKHDLYGLTKKITELQQLDSIVPSILEDLKSKPEEFTRSIKTIFTEFLKSIKTLSQDMEEMVVKDSSFKDLYKTLEKEAAHQIRASKYGLTILNSDLVALKQMKPPINVLEFYLHYLSERIEKESNLVPEGEKIFLAESIFDVHGQHGSILKELTKNALLKTTYKRVGIVLSMASDHYVLVEVSINTVKGLKELCIYDSNIKEYQHMHSKVHGLFRDVMNEAEMGLMSQTASKFNPESSQGLQMGSFMRIRHVNCPQVLNRNDSSLYALKNAQLFTENLKIGPGSYSSKDIETFRYDVFTAVAKSKFGDLH